MSKRTTTEILKQADKSNNIDELIKLESEIIKNKYQYSLVEIDFAIGHLINKSRELADKHSKQIKDFIKTLIK